MFLFNIRNNLNYNNGKVFYYSDEETFDFSPRINSDISLLVAYLNIGIDSESMRATQVWGISPKKSWIKSSINLSDYEKGELILINNNYSSGLSWRIDSENIWKSYYDENTGWHCTGSIIFDENCKGVEFATNTIAVLKKNELHSILLKPNFII